jgi:hypothetical protein
MNSTKQTLQADATELDENSLFSFNIPRDSVLKNVTKISTPYVNFIFILFYRFTHLSNPSKTRMLMKDFLSFGKRMGKFAAETLKLADSEVVAIESKVISFIYSF